MPLFDAYLMVDWSAASVPNSGADSIWYAEYRREGRRLVRRALANPPTRAAATAEIAERLLQLAQADRRVLAGFDFPFGYPAGTASRLGAGGTGWRAVWQTLTDGIEDDAANANNRFDLAERLNERISGEAFPFWGQPRGGRARRSLLARGRRPHRQGDLAERRICERRVRRAQPVWKLASIGAVGGQALTGIPRVWQIRRDPRLSEATRIWPFETGLRQDPDARIVLAEVYPSHFAADRFDGLPKDAGQVSAAASGFARLDGDGQLAELLGGDPGLTAAERRAVETEEAWILGAGGGFPP